SAELIFGYSRTNNQNPQIPIDNRKNGSFIFKEKIEMNVTGKVGDKMELGLTYNTDATFDFDNKTKLNYTGKEDEIVKKIEAGDVSFNVPGSLISGSQSLFGIKTELQFGKLTVASVFSHQRGESSSINVQGGAQQTEFEVDVDDYDENRHFFLSHFFRDNYNKWLKNLPHIESQMQIDQVEVWVVNKQNNFEEVRNIVAFMDLAEGYGPVGDTNFYANDELIRPKRLNGEPSDNTLNSIYGDLADDDGVRQLSTVDKAVTSYKGNYEFEAGRDYVILESARPLSEREFSVNRELGYISLNSPLRNDEVLAVAFTYRYKSQTYYVGELTAGNNAKERTLIVKLLKGTTQSPKFSNWDLMMKNVYSIGAYQVSSEGFKLDILYRDNKTGSPVNFIAVDTLRDPISANVNKKNLLKVMNLDNLDARNQPNPDGYFDFIEGITIDTRKGRIFFP
ncbi:MAG: cell surface protein SprA, partial [Bacteroidales bacterium]|nr:cell surface protein SprA [Bacteroidales bacterium]